MKRLERQGQKQIYETENRERVNANELELLKQKQHELFAKEEEMRRSESDFDKRRKRLEDQDKQRIETSNSELWVKREQLNAALAESVRREHEQSLRENSMGANEIEFETRLKRLEKTRKTKNR